MLEALQLTWLNVIINLNVILLVNAIHTMLIFAYLIILSPYFYHLKNSPTQPISTLNVQFTFYIKSMNLTIFSLYFMLVLINY